MPFTIHKEGIRWFLGFFATSLVLAFFSAWAAAFCLMAGVLTALFFRIPKRTSPQGENLILSPADGKIVSIDETEEPQFLKSRCCRISIFLSVLDVHMNYAPAQGIIDWVQYQPGSFHWAFVPKASDLNENQRIGIRCAKGDLLMRQIAGAVARRIVLFKRVSEQVWAGERIGLIKFGSRVEVYMPLDSLLKVKVGDRVQGGLTVLAHRAS